MTKMFTAKRIVDEMMNAGFEAWEQESFMPYIRGDEGHKSKDQLVTELEEMLDDPYANEPNAVALIELIQTTDDFDTIDKKGVEVFGPNWNHVQRLVGIECKKVVDRFEHVWVVESQNADNEYQSFVGVYEKAEDAVSYCSKWMEEIYGPDCVITEYGDGVIRFIAEGGDMYDYFITKKELK